MAAQVVQEAAAGQPHNRQHARCSAPSAPDNFTIFEGTSEMQPVVIGDTPGNRNRPERTLLDDGHEKLPGDGQMTARWRT